MLALYINNDNICFMGERCGCQPPLKRHVEEVMHLPFFCFLFVTQSIKWTDFG